MLRSILLALSVVAAPALADTVTVDTFDGPVEVETNPDTIAVFDIAALDTLGALGITADGAVAPLYLPYVEETAGDATVVGSLFEPDMEAVAALGPDLIIAGGRSQKAVPQLARMAPTLDMTIWDDAVGEGLARLDAYGKIFGKEAEATALRADFETKLEAAKAAVAGKGKALIVMTNGPKVSAYGAGGRFGWLHTALDLPEVIDGVEQTTHGEAISFEFIKEADPDILIVIDRLVAIGREGESARTTLDNALVRDTTAWKTGNVVYVDSGALYIAGGGIQSMNRILDQFIDTFGDG
ncbi:siderophore ABC transporter substrate-binding protein [Chachezhania antarctica]|uniref:siderophore ABC transporter substrate-binding protein n=1 Tax=Chachezhania antarctica TaxID=2340860 RepID=UPI000EB569DC|nr:siderophore ABC transporter substrate-binding protein [Chachezhania antarctica]|tara:strand:- start:3312 stop:4202 length:891 start_codon:yes stop_codon:yes gene_type:complete